MMATTGSSGSPAYSSSGAERKTTPAVIPRQRPLSCGVDLALPPPLRASEIRTTDHARPHLCAPRPRAIAARRRRRPHTRVKPIAAPGDTGGRRGACHGRPVGVRAVRQLPPARAPSRLGRTANANGAAQRNAVEMRTATAALTPQRSAPALQHFSGNDGGQPRAPSALNAGSVGVSAHGGLSLCCCCAIGKQPPPRTEGSSQAR